MNLGSENAVGRSSVKASGSEVCFSDSCRTETWWAADSETMSFTSRSSSSAPFLTDSSESEASYVHVNKEVSCHVYSFKKHTLLSASNTSLKNSKTSPFATLAMLYMLSQA